MVLLKDIEAIDNGARFHSVDLHIHSYGASHDLRDAAMTPKASFIDTKLRQIILKATPSRSRDVTSPNQVRYIRLARTGRTLDTTEVSIPPEVTFDRYFRELKPSLRAIYEGKHDLERLENPDLREILLKLQRGFICALGNERQVTEHRDHPPFHMDYIKSTVPNALAFRHDGYCFVGVTIPLIATTMDLCGRLSKSADVLAAVTHSPTRTARCLETRWRRIVEPEALSRKHWS
jgi:hypothetical protein